MSDDWQEWKNVILIDLKDLKSGAIEVRKKLESDHNTLMTELRKVHIELATLKIKASVWGAVAGMVPTIAALMFWLVSKTR